MHSLLQKQNHLFWRAGFGPTPDMLIQSTTFSPEKYFYSMLKVSEKLPLPFKIVQNAVDGLGNGIGELGRQQPMMQGDTLSMAEKNSRNQQQSRQEIRSLNLAWLDEMAESPAQLREKMSLFWHGYFACRNLNSFYQQQLINVIREHALSDFGTLLFEVSKTPAMLLFLNNQQNRKTSPNENFAREVMELFTLGRGNFSEEDVKEAARAFTGWSFNLQGQFQFRPFQHDSGEKKVLGYIGTLTGEDVLDILLKQKQTAKFVCTKLYKFFVNDNVNSNHVNWLAKRFFESGYAIKPLLKDIFTANWFYSSENIGTHIKSPIELLVGIRRQLPMKIGNREIQLLLQRALGQILFYPPNVAGWPGGKCWIDSSSLLLRMRLPQMMTGNDGIEINVKMDDDTEMGQAQKLSGAVARYSLNTTIDWNEIFETLDVIPEQKRFTFLTASFIQTKWQPQEKFITQFTGRTNDAKKIMVALMSLPEYQLC